jgi:hypothetical protein
MTRERDRQRQRERQRQSERERGREREKGGRGKRDLFCPNTTHLNPTKAIWSLCY